MDQFYTRCLIQYLTNHDLLATQVGNQLQTTNHYTDSKGNAHSEPVLIDATWQAVREFLGY